MNKMGKPAYHAIHFKQELFSKENSTENNCYAIKSIENVFVATFYK